MRLVIPHPRTNPYIRAASTREPCQAFGPPRVNPRRSGCRGGANFKFSGRRTCHAVAIVVAIAVAVVVVDVVIAAVVARTHTRTQHARTHARGTQHAARTHARAHGGRRVGVGGCLSRRGGLSSTPGGTPRRPHRFEGPGLGALPPRRAAPTWTGGCLGPPVCASSARMGEGTHTRMPHARTHACHTHARTHARSTHAARTHAARF